MRSYTFYTIHTVVEVGAVYDTSVVSNSNKNLLRLLESIMTYSYPMMVSLSTAKVDLNKQQNAGYYALPAVWGECTVSTFKFALPLDVDISIDGIPVVNATVQNGIRISKFRTIGEYKNISIAKQTFTSTQ